MSPCDLRDARALVIKSDAPLFSGGAGVATVFLGKSRQEGGISFRQAWR